MMKIRWMASRRGLFRGIGMARAMSAQVSRSTTLPLLTGWDAHVEHLVRTIQRLPRWINYRQQHVFAPSLSTAHHALMFLALNAPQHLDLDVMEFLDGAAGATKRVLDDARTHEFVQFVMLPNQVKEKITASPLVRRLQSCCLPGCFEQLEATVFRRIAKRKRMRTLNVHVESAHLTRVQYACVPENNVGDLGDDIQPALVEHLQLQVEVRTLERLQCVENEDICIELHQRKVYVARFASTVTDPDLLDWRLASIAVRTRGKPEITDTSATPGPAIQ